MFTTFGMLLRATKITTTVAPTAKPQVKRWAEMSREEQIEARRGWEREGYTCNAIEFMWDRSHGLS